MAKVMADYEVQQSTQIKKLEDQLVGLKDEMQKKTELTKEELHC